MIIRSQLPRVVGEYEPGWGDSLKGHAESRLALRTPAGSDDKELQENLKWFKNHPRLFKIFNDIDYDFRQQHDIEGSVALKHDFGVRTGWHNMSGVLQGVATTFMTNESKEKLSALWHTASHIDGRPSQNSPREVYTMASRDPTLWYGGTFVVPFASYGDISSVIFSMMTLGSQTFLRDPWCAEPDQLIASTPDAVHNMPAIELGAALKTRVFLRDFVSLTDQAQAVA